MYGERLKKIRKEKKLSQEKVAELISISRSSISKFENEKEEPSIDILVKLCDLYRISTDYVLGRTNDKRGIGYADSYKAKIEQHDNEIAIGEININKGGN